MDLLYSTRKSNFGKRTTIEALYRQSKYFSEQHFFNIFADSVSEFVMILNDKGQIVFSNNRFSKFLNVENNKQIVGMNPGELFHCTHSSKPNGLCGRNESCSMCGIYKAFTTAEQGIASTTECRINRNDNLCALDILVRATPIQHNGSNFIILAVTDSSDEKRRKSLESIFFHDVLNTAGGLLGYSELLKESTEFDRENYTEIIYDLAQELIEQIMIQQEISKAEHSEIIVAPEPIHSLTLLPSIATTYRRYRISIDRHIVVDLKSEDFVFISDDVLLKRIIGNLLKNALEASGNGETVTLGCKRLDQEVQFWVHNETVIPHDVQLQIFQRLFSTKGEGRGIGTYGVKLLTERYLKGKVHFISNQDDGTIFTVTLPIIFGSSDNQLPKRQKTIPVYAK